MTTPPTDEADIDALYGLEPVIELDASPEGLDAFLDVLCPFCGETYGLAVDLSAGARSFVEDCTVCCHPIAMTLDLDGEVPRLHTERPG